MTKKKKKKKDVIEEAVYAYKSGRRYKVEAQNAGEELERIRSRDGNLKTQIVVDEARPEIGVLHPIFEWDDFAAAEQHRRNQARTLVRSIRVEMPGKEPDAPMFVHVKPITEPTGYYQTPEIVVKNIGEFEAAMSEAVLKMESAKRAVSELETLASKTKDKDRLAMVTLAVKALDTANSALMRIH